jgi:tetratricopeptide (TPR) repeat protein
MSGLTVTAQETAQKTSDQLVGEAVQLYGTRHLNPPNLQKSQELLKTVLEKEPDNLRANYELARVCYIAGDSLRQDNKDAALGLYRTGMEYARKAIAINPDNPWGHIWYAVNLGRTAQVKGILNSLSSAAEIKKEIARALQIDPDNTIALDVEAVIYYELPGIFGGDTKRSIEDLTHAIKVDPNFSLPYVEMGRIFARKGDYAKAREYFQKVLALQNPTSPADYILLDRPHAEHLLKELEGK